MSPVLWHMPPILGSEISFGYQGTADLGAKLAEAYAGRTISLPP